MTIEDYLVHISTHMKQAVDAPPPAVELPANEAQLTRAEYAGKGIEIECRICLRDYKEKDKLIYLPCMHLYHEECILDWMHRAKTDADIFCPFCLKQVYNIQQ